MIVSKTVLFDNLITMIESFKKDYNGINEEIFSLMSEKIEILLDQVELDSEKRIINITEIKFNTAIRELISEIIKL